MGCLISDLTRRGRRWSAELGARAGAGAGAGAEADFHGSGRHEHGPQSWHNWQPRDSNCSNLSISSFQMTDASFIENNDSDDLTSSDQSNLNSGHATRHMETNIRKKAKITSGFLSILSNGIAAVDSSKSHLISLRNQRETFWLSPNNKVHQLKIQASASDMSIDGLDKDPASRRKLSDPTDSSLASYAGQARVESTNDKSNLSPSGDSNNREEPATSQD